jgi:MipA family protein
VKARTLALLGLVIAGCAAPQAASAQFWINEQGWIVTVSANAVASPAYIGASTYSFGAWPVVSIRRAQNPARFAAADDGVSIAFFGDRLWAAGLVGRYQSGRYYSDDRDLYGLEDVKWSIQPGVFAELWPVADTLRIRGELRFGINGFNGLVGNISADYVQRFGQFSFYTGPRIGLGGSDYAQAYFSVSPEEAAINNLEYNGGLTPYNASGGLMSLGWAAAIRYAYDENWSGTLHFGYDRLTGSAADSPVTQVVGSENQFNVRASVSYSFFWGGLK